MESKNNNLVSYYTDYDEAGRLASPWGQVEYVRSQLLLERFLPPAPARVLDVGGAAGRYACWLSTLGYEVHLIDPVPLHLEQAQAASDAQPASPIASIQLGDARQLPFDDASAEAVLLMGPLYHLTEAEDRRQALAEAYRVLMPGRKVFAVCISRFASTIDGFDSGYFLDPDFQQIMHHGLTTGQHRNPTGNPGYFMDTYFHHPDELKEEVAAAGFELARLFAIEGVGYMVTNLEKHWQDAKSRAFILETLAKLETEPSLMGASPHIMCVGEKSS